MEELELIENAGKLLGLTLNGTDANASRTLMIIRINDLILQDFDKLIAILYRADVNERKISELLKQFPGEDAAALITDLIIEREVQKLDSRKKYGKSTDDVSSEEKW